MVPRSAIPSKVKAIFLARSPLYLAITKAGSTFSLAFKATAISSVA